MSSQTEEWLIQLDMKVTEDFLTHFGIMLPVQVHWSIDLEDEAGALGRHRVITSADSDEVIMGHYIEVDVSTDQNLENANQHLIHELRHAMQAEQFETGPQHEYAALAQRESVSFNEKVGMQALTLEEAEIYNSTPWEKEAIEFEKEAANWQLVSLSKL